MPYKHKEDRAAQMRRYRKRKRAELEQLKKENRWLKRALLRKE